MKEFNEQEKENFSKTFKLLLEPDFIKRFEEEFNEYSLKRRGDIITFSIIIEERIKDLIISFYHIRNIKRESFREDILSEMSMIHLISIIEKNVKRKYHNNKPLLKVYLKFIKIIKNMNIIRNCYAHYNPDIDFDFNNTKVDIDLKIDYKRKGKTIDLEKAYEYFLKYSFSVFTFLSALENNMTILSFIEYNKYSYEELFQELQRIDIEFEDVRR